MDRRERVEQALKKDTTLPTGPAVLGRIAELCKNPNASARDLGKVLQLDTGLTTRLLKQVNSSFYGLSTTVKTVTHAVVILGFQEVKHLVFSTPVADFFEANRNSKGIDIAQLWNDSIEIACLARTISYHIRHPIPEQVFISGILCEIGMVILNNILGEEYAELVQSCLEEDFLPEMELAELGISHTEVGRRLATRWRFPEELLRPILYHHDPLAEGSVILEAGLPFVARHLLHQSAQGQTIAEILETIPPELLTTFSLDSTAAGECLEKAKRDFESAKKMLAGE